MKRNLFYPTQQAQEIVWVANFINKLPGYAAALGLTPDQVNAAVADGLWLLYIYILQSWLRAARKWNTSCTSALTAAQTGND